MAAPRAPEAAAAAAAVVGHGPLLSDPFRFDGGAAIPRVLDRHDDDVRRRPEPPAQSAPQALTAPKEPLGLGAVISDPTTNCKNQFYTLALLTGSKGYLCTDLVHGVCTH